MYKETILDNGIIVASDAMADIESISVGVYINAGARQENEHNNGVAHFLEHMAFKGTKTRTAQDIARELEDVGGNMNAYTSYENTAYHVKILHEHLPLAMDILGDILQNSTFDTTEMERERDVILQEIAQTIDTPDDLVFENLQTVCWPNQSIGRPILGTVETVKNIQKTDLQQFINSHYTGQNMVISAAGRVEHENLVQLAKQYFANIPQTDKNTAPPAKYTGSQLIQPKELEQAHIIIAHEGIGYSDKDYYAANIWCSILGGGMSSRLFQEIREKRGLAYSVFSYNSSYYDTGSFGVYAGTSKEHVAELIKVIRQECEKSLTDLTDEELNRAKAQYTAGMRMAQENTDSRMGRIPLCHFTEGRFKPLAESLADIEKVTLKDCADAGAKILSTPQSISALGAVNKTLAI